MVDLAGIETFTRVAEAGSFTAAARRLGVPKSTVSRRVASLEEQLGVQLLKRTTRRVVLTDEGRAYFEGTRRVLDDLEECESRVTAMRAEPRGLLRVTATADLGAAILPGVAAQFLSRFPRVELELLLTDRVVDLVGERVDIGIRSGPLPDSSLLSRRLGSVRFGIFGSPAYLREHGTPQKPADLAKHACVIFTAPHRPRFWCRGVAAGVTVRGRLASDSLAVVRQAALDGLGLARLPEFTCQAEARAGRLVRVLDGTEEPARDLFAVYPGSRVLAPRVRAFVDLLAQSFAASERGAAKKSRRATMDRSRAVRNNA